MSNAVYLSTLQIWCLGSGTMISPLSQSSVFVRLHLSLAASYMGFPIHAPCGLVYETPTFPERPIDHECGAYDTPLIYAAKETSVQAGPGVVTEWQVLVIGQQD